jgi:hypothetical protein
MMQRKKFMLPLVWLLLLAISGLKPALAQIDAGGITGGFESTSDQRLELS